MTFRSYGHQASALPELPPTRGVCEAPVMLCSKRGLWASEDVDEDGEDGKVSYTSLFCVVSLITEDANEVVR